MQAPNYTDAARRALIVLRQYGSMPSVAVRELEDDGLLATDEVKARAWAEGFERGFSTGASIQYADEPDVVNPYEGES